MPHSGIGWLRETCSADLGKLPRDPLSLGSVVNRIIFPSLNRSEVCGKAGSSQNTKAPHSCFGVGRLAGSPALSQNCRGTG